MREKLVPELEALAELVELVEATDEFPPGSADAIREAAKELGNCAALLAGRRTPQVLDLLFSEEEVPDEPESSGRGEDV